LDPSAASPRHIGTFTKNNPAPSDGIDQHATGDEPQDEAERCCHAEVAEHAFAVGALGVARRQDREGGRRNECGGNALHRPCRHEQWEVHRDAPCGRGQREQHETGN
jgi:hypothetical protein